VVNELDIIATWAVKVGICRIRNRIEFPSLGILVIVSDQYLVYMQFRFRAVLTCLGALGPPG